LKFTDESSAVQRLLRLRLKQELGSGTYGVIYVARDLMTGLQWVAKFPKPMTTESTPGELESNRGHLRQEFAAMSRLEHPNVVRALGLCLGEDGLAPALLMERYDSDLKMWIERQEPERVASTVVEKGLLWSQKSCLVQILSGLAHVHGRGIVHVDIKPENIFVKKCQSSTWFAIGDFGVSRALRRVPGVPHGCVPSKEVNTAIYRPLDLFAMDWRSVKPSSRFDLWAWGCVPFEATAWINPMWRRHGSMRRLFGELSMTPQSSAEHNARERIRLHGPRHLTPIIYADMWTHAAPDAARKLTLDVEALRIGRVRKVASAEAEQ